MNFYQFNQIKTFYKFNLTEEKMISHEESILQFAKEKPQSAFGAIIARDKKGLVKPEDAKEYQRAFMRGFYARTTYPLLGALTLIGITYPYAPKSVPGAVVTYGLATWLGVKIGGAIARNSNRVQSAEEEQNAILNKYSHLLKDPKVLLSLKL